MTQTQTTPERMTVTVEEAAHLLGIGRQSAYQAVRAGEIVAIRLGRRLLVPRAQIDRMLGLNANARKAALLRALVRLRRSRSRRANVCPQGNHEDLPGLPRRDHGERVPCPPDPPDPTLRRRPELDSSQAFIRAPQVGGGFVLDVPDNVPAVWGSGDDVLWASGEPLMICGPQGVGKTTLAQQLALARAGVLEPELLGLPVAPDDKPVLYIAADRPAQAARSMRRMVTEDQRDQLDKRLLAWRGPLPFTITDDPRRLAAWLTLLGVGTVVIDSLKDVAVGLSDDAVAAGVNIALQEVVACGIEVVDLHHQRKGQDGRKPRTLEDVYGNTWLTAGHGSVVLLWGEPGDPFVSLTHLKQPASEIGPLDVQHDHGRGRSTLPGAVDLLDLAAKGVTALQAAQAIYDTSSPNRNQRERARRRLDKLESAGNVRREPGTVKSDPVTYWLACVNPREGSRDPLSEGVTQGHDLALEAFTDPVTQGFGGNGTPYKGGREVVRDPQRDALQDRADDIEARYLHREAAA